MKKVLLTSICIFCLAAVSARTAETVFLEKFDSLSTEWKLPEGFAWKKGEGINSSGALFYERTDTKKNHMANRLIRTLKPKTAYRLTVTYKTDLKEDPKNGVMEIFALNHLKQNQRLFNSFFAIKKQNSKGWEKMSMKFTTPAESDAVRLLLFLRFRRIGKIWFDEIRIETIQ